MLPDSEEQRLSGDIWTLTFGIWVRAPARGINMMHHLTYQQKSCLWRQYMVLLTPDLQIAHVLRRSCQGVKGCISGCCRVSEPQGQRSGLTVGQGGGQPCQQQARCSQAAEAGSLSRW